MTELDKQAEKYVEKEFEICINGMTIAVTRYSLGVMLKEFASQVREQSIAECARIAGGSTGPGNTPEQCEGYTAACNDIKKAITLLAGGKI